MKQPPFYETFSTSNLLRALSEEEVAPISQNAIDRLNAVKETIVARPTEFDMCSFFDVPDHSHNNSMNHLQKVAKERLDKQHTCNTTACIAGWLVTLDRVPTQVCTNATAGLLSLKPREPSNEWESAEENTLIEDPEDVAVKLLRIPLSVTGYLFYHGSWPWQLTNRYDDAEPYSKEQAEAAVEAIDWFVATLQFFAEGGKPYRE